MGYGGGGPQGRLPAEDEVNVAAEADRNLPPIVGGPKKKLLSELLGTCSPMGRRQVDET